MSMALGKVFEPFAEQRPICVMARGVLEHLFGCRSHIESTLFTKACLRQGPSAVSARHVDTV